MTKTQITPTAHARELAYHGTGDDKTITVSCTCKAFEVTGLANYVTAAIAYRSHKESPEYLNWVAFKNAEFQFVLTLRDLRQAQRALDVARAGMEAAESANEAAGAALDRSVASLT